jgi:hypothetical protein
MKRVAALLFALCAASLAHADIGPPAGKKGIPVTTIIEVTEDFPDYAFFETSYSSTPGPPPHGGSSSSVTFHFFVPGTTMKRTGDRRSGGGLYAMPRAEAEKIPGWKGYAADAAKHQPNKHATIGTSETQQWFAIGRSIKNGEIPGAITTRFGGSENVPTDDPRTSITETFRVVRTPGGVAFVNPDDPAAKPDKHRVDGDVPASTESESSIPWKWIVVGAVGSFGLILGGVWLVMRFANRGGSHEV